MRVLSALWRRVVQRIRKNTVTTSPFELAYATGLHQMAAIRTVKRALYSPGDDPILNYRRTAEVAGIPVTKLMVMRTMEKVIRLLQDVECDKPGESRNDDLLDIANIALLVYAERNQQPADNPHPEATAVYVPPSSTELHRVAQQAYRRSRA
jgi:hypothetical protein